MIEVQEVCSVSELEPYRRDWSNLCKNALDQNLYFTPQFLVPGLQYYGVPGKYSVLFFYSQLAGTRKLIAMLPIMAKARSWVLPCRTASSHVYEHCYLCFPIIHKHHISDSITAIKDWLDGQKNFDVLEIVNAYENSATWRTIKDEVEKHGWVYTITKLYARPMLQRRESYDDFFQGVSKKRRKMLKHTHNRLSEIGTLSVNIYMNMIELPDLANRFMALEKLGWKGVNKTALASSVDGTQFFNAVVAEAPADAELFFTELTLDKVPIAMTANFVIGTDFFAFKVAFDPVYAKFSPGAYLEYESIRLMYSYSNFQTADSGSSGHDSYIGNIWPERQKMMTMHIAARNSLFVRLCLFYMKTNKAFRTKIRNTVAYCHSLLKKMKN